MIRIDELLKKCFKSFKDANTLTFKKYNFKFDNDLMIEPELFKIGEFKTITLSFTINEKNNGILNILENIFNSFVKGIEIDNLIIYGYSGSVNYIQKEKNILIYEREVQVVVYEKK